MNVNQQEKRFSKIIFLQVLIFLFLALLQSSSQAEDFSVSLKEGLLNKVISSKKNWEYKDPEHGIYIKLSNLKFDISTTGIIGSAQIKEFKQAKAGTSLINSLIKQASDMQDVGSLKFVTQVGLNEDHQKIVLKNTKFTAFNNRFLPRFLETGFILKELNNKFAKEIDGKIVYEFPKGFSVDVTNIQTQAQEIILDGDLILPGSVSKVPQS